MLELVKKNIHMNRWKGSATSQITLDDDFIVPDTMDDMEQVILHTGEITVESVKNQAERVVVRGKMDFTVLYRKSEGGLQTLGGSISFEEPVNVPGLEEKDYVQMSCELEDLSAGMINSRKLSMKAIVTMEIKIEDLYDVEAAVEVDTGMGTSMGNAITSMPGSSPGGAGTSAGVRDGANGFGDKRERSSMGDMQVPQIEVLRRSVDVATISLRRKDTYRIKENIQLSGNKPNIDHVLWSEMKLRGVTTRPLEGKMALNGELMVFLIYDGEGENAPVQWLEESIPFSGELDLMEASEDMVPAVAVHLIHRDVEAKPDYDGEMREFDVDAVLELDMKLYREENVELLSDLYSTNRELTLQTGKACFEKILTKNMSKCKIYEKLSIDQGDRILQICHSEGTVKIDETEVKEDGLHVEGVLEVSLLYLTADDTQPVQAAVEMIPFHYLIEAPGIDEDTICQLMPSLEQLNAVMMGGGTVEVKATVCLDLLALQPVCEQVIISAMEGPMDLKKLKQLPGIVGYIVQPEDSLWKIAKKFHTTIDTIMMTNGLTDKNVKVGERLILVKEM